MPPGLAAPPHFFRFDHGHQFQNVASPPGLVAPPHFFGFDYGHQLQNVALPPQQLPITYLFRFNDGNPPENIAIDPLLGILVGFFRSISDQILSLMKIFRSSCIIILLVRGL